MYHGKKNVNYKFSVSGKWVSNDSDFTFGFMTEKAAKNWCNKNNLERFAKWYLISKKPEHGTEKNTHLGRPI